MLDDLRHLPSGCDLQFNDGSDVVLILCGGFCLAVQIRSQNCDDKQKD